MEKNKELSSLSDKLIDYELVKKDNSSVARKYLPVFVFVASAYYSFLLALGLAVGYIGSKIFWKYLVENGKVDCVYINLGKWKLHFHHWILGSLILLLVWTIDFFYLPRFFIGVVVGIIAHDIYDFNDWRRILVKK